MEGLLRLSGNGVLGAGEREIKGKTGKTGSFFLAVENRAKPLSRYPGKE